MSEPELITGAWGPSTDVMDVTMWTNNTLPHAPPAYIARLRLANKITLSLTVIFLMLAMGCFVTLENFKEMLRRPWSILIGMLCQFVLMPVIAFCLALALSLSPAHAIGVLIVSCCPGGTVSNLFAFWTKGDVCLSISMTSLSTVAGIGLMPLNLFIYSRRWTDKNTTIPFVNIFITLVCIIVPVSVGMLIRWKKEEWTKIIGHVSSVLGILCIVINLTISAIINPNMYIVSWRLWVCLVVLPALGGSLGYILAWVLRRTPAHCRTIAYETGLQNIPIAVTVIALTFDGSPIMYPVLTFPSLYGPVMMVEALIAITLYHLVTRSCGRSEQGGTELDVDFKEVKQVEEIM